MKVLVTGATGFVGSHVARALLTDGHDVSIFRRRESPLDLLADIAADVRHDIGEIMDPDALASAMRGCQAVFHVAGAVGLEGKRDRTRLRSVNVLGTATVMNVALDLGIQRVVHTSSIAAIGRPDGTEVTIDEESEWSSSSANSEYALSKRDAEWEVRRAIAEGLDAVMVNPSLVFGPGRSGENTQRIVETVRDQKLPAVPVGGTNVVDVEDVAAGHIAALERGRTGERYILGSQNLSWREIIDTLAAALGVEAQSRTLSPRLALALATGFEVLGLIPGIKPMITREAARQTARRFHYVNDKARSELKMDFRPFSETAERLAATLQPSTTTAA